MVRNRLHTGDLQIKYRKRGRRFYLILVVTLILIIALLSIAVFIYRFHPAEETAYIEYWVDGDMRINLGEENSVILGCTNQGSKEGSFYLALGFYNASFSNQTSQPYEQISETYVKIPFTLQKRGDQTDSNTKNVFFNIDKNAGYFSFSVSIEGSDQYPVSGGIGVISYLLYEWNETGQFYEKSEGGGAVA